MLVHIPSTEIAKTKIVKAKFGQTTISAALTASALALAITYAGERQGRRRDADQGTANSLRWVFQLRLEWLLCRRGNLGLAWGRSNWTAGPGLAGTSNLFQTIDTFDEAGSFLAGLQGGLQFTCASWRRFIYSSFGFKTFKSRSRSGLFFLLFRRRLVAKSRFRKS